jgi:hypothetical protein
MDNIALKSINSNLEQSTFLSIIPYQQKSKPFLKWVGGKGQLLESFRELCPKCGRIEGRELIGKSKTIKCKECDTPMKQVQKGQQLNCPICKIPLEETSFILWD